MKLFNIITSSIFQIVSFIFVLGYLLGVLNIHFSDKNDYCMMTYMFEYPQFVRITLPANKLYPQYGLHAYSEGRFTERARKMWFDGIPVLFLPGNSGSHMQARSLASVALRKALSNAYDYHFDFFTISINEELSGLYGGVLESQTYFAAASVSRILELYRSNRYTKSIPNTVILIGHSMGGLIAKRLLAYPSTINTTNIAITLAAPLEAPVVNVDLAMNDYYRNTKLDWKYFVNRRKGIKERKLLLSFGSGPRDVLMPSGLTSSEDSYINAITTAIPGVWVSANHVGIVWCKQLVMTITKYLFDIVDPKTTQVTVDNQLLRAKAKQYFQANRSMTLSPTIHRQNATMLADAFWYEDNRRVYRISRPDFDKTTYLMIRLVNFPQNRFVAIEAVNLDDKDWIFGCNAKFTYNYYRYCKQATSLTELSRWTGAAANFGKRKLATVHLHSIMDQQPEWSHILVKVSPTKKPLTLTVDINDHASRQITVDMPSVYSFGKTIIKEETEPNSLYYELILPDFNKLHEAYLLYVEPTASCKASQYHVSAEVFVPWAKNHEYYHYFTHSKRSPMKLRLYKSNPNVTLDVGATEHVRITLLLDYQCTFTISISMSWYHRLAQLARNYTPILVPYMAAIVLLAARSNILHFLEHGTCVSIHSALMSEGVKPYYALVFGRLGALALTAMPILTVVLENASWRNAELHQFSRSMLVLPAYMTALGLLNIAAAAVIAVMVFYSQFAHRLLYRIMWRGGAVGVERVALEMQKVPMAVSVAMVFATPVSCGAASLAVGAAFYAFMISKMYEEYLEDYFYRLMAKMGSRMCRFFKSKNKKTPTKNESNTNITPAIENTSENLKVIDNKSSDDKGQSVEESKEVRTEEQIDSTRVKPTEGNTQTRCDYDNERKGQDDIDEKLNNLNFHMIMFFMWLVVTLVNVPALQTWARNFKYSMVLKEDTSYHTGLVMSACSTCLWQMDGPRKNLRYYESIAALLFTVAVFLILIGPSSLALVNYGVTYMFTVVTLQQMFDQEIETPRAPHDVSQNVQENSNISQNKQEDVSSEQRKAERKSSKDGKPDKSGNKRKQRKADNVSNENSNAENVSNEERKPDNSGNSKPAEETKEQTSENSETMNGDDCECNENRIHSELKNLREKLGFNED